MKTAILGSGSWGTALASVLATNGHQTSLWGRQEAIVQDVNQNHRNERYLKAAKLPLQLRATLNLEEAVRQADLVIYAVASQGMASTVELSRAYIPKSAILAHAVKGFDLPTKRRMSQVLQDAFPVQRRQIAVISGPSHAEEVVAGLPTTLVVASPVRKTAEQVQDALMNSVLRVYTNPDVVGAELGGSLKNIIALGVGIADGLGFGDNAKAALMTRGLAEIARLGTKMGASPLTFAGLSGIGDLIVTCTSVHSRNFRTGRLLGQGLKLEQALQQVGMAVEGIPTTKAALQLAEQYQVEMPITEALARVLFEGKNPSEAGDDLMGRARSHEIEEVAREKMSPKWLE